MVQLYNGVLNSLEKEKEVLYVLKQFLKYLKYFKHKKENTQ